MKCISLHQPWAQLLVMGIKTYETRSWPCPPKILGQRIAIHAAKRKPEHCSQVGDWMILNQGDGATRMVNDKTGQWVDLPLGAIVGTATITASLPIVADSDSILNYCDAPACVEANPASGYLMQVPEWSGALEYDDMTDISDQLPYGDWSPGRYAWPLEDAAPTTERCPWCNGSTQEPGFHWGDECHVCDGRGRCDPVPAAGRQDWWIWETA